MRAGEEERFRPDLGLDRVRGDDGRAQQVACRRLARGWVDEVMKLSAAPLPGAPVATRGRQAAALELERQRAAATAIVQRRPRRAMSPPALTRHGPAGGQDRRGLFGGVALADAAEVEPDAAIELDQIPVDPDFAAARSAAAGAGPSSGSSAKVRS